MPDQMQGEGDVSKGEGHVPADQDSGLDDFFGRTRPLFQKLNGLRREECF